MFVFLNKDVCRIFNSSPVAFIVISTTYSCYSTHWNETMWLQDHGRLHRTTNRLHMCRHTRGIVSMVTVIWSSQHGVSQIICITFPHLQVSLSSRTAHTPSDYHSNPERDREGEREWKSDEANTTHTHARTRTTCKSTMSSKVMQTNGNESRSMFWNWPVNHIRNKEINKVQKYSDPLFSTSYCVESSWVKLHTLFSL